MLLHMFVIHVFQVTRALAELKEVINHMGNSRKARNITGGSNAKMLGSRLTDTTSRGMLNKPP